MPTAKGGNANSINALVMSIDQLKMGSRLQVTPFARVLAIVVMKFTEDIVTETANNAMANAASVAPV